MTYTAGLGTATRRDPRCAREHIFGARCCICLRYCGCLRCCGASLSLFVCFLCAASPYQLPKTDAFSLKMPTWFNGQLRLDICRCETAEAIRICLSLYASDTRPTCLDMPSGELQRSAFTSFEGSGPLVSSRVQDQDHSKFQQPFVCAWPFCQRRLALLSSEGKERRESARSRDTARE